MYAWIAAKAKRLWDTGPAGQVAAILFVAFAAFGSSMLRYGAKKAVVNAATGCGIDEKGMNQRASSIVAELEKRHGPAKPFGHGSDRLVFPEGQFDIVSISMNDPCDSFLAIRVPIVGDVPTPLPPDQMLKALEDRDLGGRYERGLGGSFQYDEGSKNFYISWIVPLKQERDSTIGHTVDERRSIGEAWRKGWFEEVSRIATGEAPMPKGQVYRPGKDFDSVMHEIDAFLKDAGQEGIYP